MSLFAGAIVLPLFQVIAAIVFFIVIIFMLLCVIFMFVSVPEIRVLFKAAHFKKYVLFNHSSYAVAKISAVKISDVSLKPLQNEAKFRPRGKDDVERTDKIRWIHSHEMTPYPISSTTAYIVDKFVGALKSAGLSPSISNIDAILRCGLDESQMIGYVDDYITEENPVLDADGNPTFDVITDAEGNVFKKAIFERKVTKKTYQMQVSDDEMVELKKLKLKLEMTWVGIDSGGSDIFSYSHLGQVVNILMAGTPATVDDLQHIAERHGIMKSRIDNKNLMLYAIVAFILVIAGGTFLRFVGVV
ncbi:MAG: hypothetical protein FWE54_01670 [Methanimicrococcus sp.]|nr:hypothetical protein [Methanimicrococcus sp.]